MLRSFFFGAWPLFTGLFFIIVGNSIQGSLIAYRTGFENYSYAVSGLIISGYFLGMLASVFSTPHFLNTVGHVRLFAALTAMLSATLLVFPLIVHPLVWFLLRLIVGFCYVGLFIITEAWINALSTNEMRGRTMSIYMLVQFVGYISGQLLLGLGTPESPALFLLASIGVSIAVVPMLMVRVTVPPQPESSKIMNFKELYQLSPFSIVGTLLVAMISAILYASLGFFAQKLGMNLQQLSVLTILVFLAAMISQWPLAKLSDRVDRRMVIIGLSSAAVIISSIGAGLSMGNLTTIYLAVFVLSLAVMPLYSINIAHINDIVPTDKIVAAGSTIQLIGATGAFFGPTLMTGFMKATGASGFFLFFVFGNALLLGYAFYRRYARTVTVHHHTALTPMTQLQSAQMDPIQLADDNVQWDIAKNEAPAYKSYSLILDIFRNILKANRKIHQKPSMAAAGSGSRSATQKNPKRRKTDSHAGGQKK